MFVNPLLYRLHAIFVILIYSYRIFMIAKYNQCCMKIQSSAQIQLNLNLNQFIDPLSPQAGSHILDLIFTFHSLII
jgi:hypothetical protein